MNAESSHKPANTPADHITGYCRTNWSARNRLLGRCRQVLDICRAYLIHRANGSARSLDRRADRDPSGIGVEQPIADAIEVGVIGQTGRQSVLIWRGAGW